MTTQNMAGRWCICRSLVSIRCTIPVYSQVRNSRYSPVYLEPTFRRENLNEQLVEDDPRRFQPIKAAQNDQVSLSSYDEVIAKFVRIIMREGNKERARYIVDKTLENIKLSQIEKFHKSNTDFERDSVELDPKKIVHQAIENCKPLLTLQKVKRGGVMYQVPIPVKLNTQTFKAIRWLIESSADKDRGVRIWDKLPFELLDAYNNEGKSVRKKQDLHRVCEANRTCLDAALRGYHGHLETVIGVRFRPAGEDIK